MAKKVGALKVRLESIYLVVSLRKGGASISKAVVFGENVSISRCKMLSIGANVAIGSGAFIKSEGGLSIGDNVVLSRNVSIYTCSHEYEGDLIPYDERVRNRAVIIENNVWIGRNVNILPGTHIGEGAIIGLGATVFGKIKPGAIVGAASYNVMSARDMAHYNTLKNERRFRKNER